MGAVLLLAGTVGATNVPAPDPERSLLASRSILVQRMHQEETLEHLFTYTGDIAMAAFFAGRKCVYAELVAFIDSAPE